jgi:hypothetical protein
MGVMFGNFSSEVPLIYLGHTSDLPLFASVPPQFNLYETSGGEVAKKTQRKEIKVSSRHHLG